MKNIAHISHKIEPDATKQNVKLFARVVTLFLIIRATLVSNGKTVRKLTFADTVVRNYKKDTLIAS